MCNEEKSRFLSQAYTLILRKADAFLAGYPNCYQLLHVLFHEQISNAHFSPRESLIIFQKRYGVGRRKVAPAIVFTDRVIHPVMWCREIFQKLSTIFFRLLPATDTCDILVMVKEYHTYLEYQGIGK